MTDYAPKCPKVPSPTPLLPPFPSSFDQPNQPPSLARSPQVNPVSRRRRQAATGISARGIRVRRVRAASGRDGPRAGSPDKTIGGFVADSKNGSLNCLPLNLQGDSGGRVDTLVGLT